MLNKVSSFADDTSAKMDQQPPNKHFKLLSNEELKSKMTDLENTNSVYAEKQADKVSGQFLSAAGALSQKCHLFEEDELDNWLAKFWFGACTTKGDDFYTVNSLKSFKYGLKRHLQKIGHAYNITKDTALKGAQ